MSTPASAGCEQTDEKGAAVHALRTLGDLLIPDPTLLEHHDFQRNQREFSIFLGANWIADTSVGARAYRCDLAGFACVPFKVYSVCERSDDFFRNAIGHAGGP